MWTYHNKPSLGWSIDWSHPLANGLVGYWPMNEGTGNLINNLSGNNNKGTLVADTHWVPGKFGHALDFDGVGDCIDCGTNDVIGMGNKSSFTISTWVKLNAKIADRPIITRGMPVVVYMLWWDAGEDLWEFFVRDSESGLHYAKHNFNPNIGQWYHVVSIWNGTDILIYVDGVIGTTTSAITTILNETGDITYIGHREEIVSPSYFNGQIDNVLIYNRALTASEIRQLYMFPFCIHPTDPMELWIPPVVTGGIMTATKYWGT